MTSEKEALINCYTVITALHTLVKLMEAKDEAAFAKGMRLLWQHLYNQLPKKLQETPLTEVLRAYFVYQGDLPRALREHEAYLEKVVGHETHQEAMRRSKQALSALETLLKGVVG